ncbi:MAG: hypothetical protein NT120_02190 [Candidatus Aenigmarchaeota archaeon]|nr:hypothetical protein [Candidatus Aenigmarchaeota archaeon]
MALEDIFQNIVMFGIGSTLITFLVKSVITNHFSKDLERFSKLHEKRGLVIEELYGKLRDMESAMHTFANPFQYTDADMEEKGKNAASAVNEFVKLANKNRIYFDKKTCQVFDTIQEIARRSFNRIQTYDVHNLSSVRAGRTEQLKAWEESFDEIDRGIPSLRAMLETEFRTILGVPTD